MVIFATVRCLLCCWVSSLLPSSFASAMIGSLGADRLREVGRRGLFSGEGEALIVESWSVISSTAFTNNRSNEVSRELWTVSASERFRFLIGPVAMVEVSASLAMVEERVFVRTIKIVPTVLEQEMGSDRCKHNTAEAAKETKDSRRVKEQRVVKLTAALLSHSLK